MEKNSILSILKMIIIALAVLVISNFIFNTAMTIADGKGVYNESFNIIWTVNLLLIPVMSYALSRLFFRKSSSRSVNDVFTAYFVTLIVLIIFAKSGIQSLAYPLNITNDLHQKFFEKILTENFSQSLSVFLSVISLMVMNLFIFIPLLLDTKRREKEIR